MKSIGARLTVWYALTATATLLLLFVGGYFLLQGSLIRGLDLLNAAEFQQIRSRLGAEPEHLDSYSIDERIRDTTEYAKVLFYIDVHSPEVGTVFRSRNLADRHIPDVKGKRTFNVDIPDIGELRVGEFIIKPYEVMIATSLQQARETMSLYVNVCAALLCAMLVVSTFIGLGLSRLMLEPVRAIRRTALRIGSNNFDERIPVAEVKDEIADLARLLNKMFDRLAASFDQIRRFSADASHELKTPLSLVRLHAEKLLMSDTLLQSQRESVLVQLDELARVNQIIEELLFLARADAHAIKLAPQTQAPEIFLNNFAQDAAVLAEDRGLYFSFTHQGAGLVEIEANRLRQVLLNLLSNALKISPPGSTVTLDSVLRSDLWRISVTDEGPGLDSEQRDRMFDRFVRFAVDADDRGSGLGLAICRTIVELHRGRIHAERGPLGRGLRVVIELPVVKNAPQAATEAVEQRARG
ncbi:ATP-binding protein [Azoarcus sp. KH32C]|uniref:HAMP domain-containing sensor histidine kinase n=1 Tax=Azoarcus sp. KH32C TaxID=748247 RepID=UPI0002385E18|nr:ATP-binding protein [Azoarcus sp. KH32C]BAL27203.1 two-component system, OmpR family, heavy metal sensor histidine kinase [Azoarcus sp. KH32C]